MSLYKVSDTMNFLYLQLHSSALSQTFFCQPYLFRFLQFSVFGGEKEELDLNLFLPGGGGLSMWGTNSGCGMV